MRETPYLNSTAKIVAAHVAHNAVQPKALPNLIQTVYRTLAMLGTGSPSEVGTVDRATPAVPVNRSVFLDYIICLEDGKRLRMNWSKADRSLAGSSTFGGSAPQYGARMPEKRDQRLKTFRLGVASSVGFARRTIGTS